MTLKDTTLKTYEYVIFSAKWVDEFPAMTEDDQWEAWTV
jgi:hypothetical protein